MAKPSKRRSRLAPQTIGHIAGVGRVVRGYYEVDMSTVVYAGDGEDRVVLSVNVEGAGCADGEFVVGAYQLPASIVRAALASGLFEDTGRRVSFGYVEDAPVWRIVEPTVVA